ncbi:MAG: hypothetical protein H6529_07155 [Nocardioides sp.]|nr:hypothetical protein [Nocardioidaceae bacterium]MCB8956246.1 hypothetical protein [Nocardioides sp.]
MQTLEALGQLFGAYFHQDWDLDNSDEWEVLESFMRTEPRRARMLPDEIDSVLSTIDTEEQLKSLVIDQLGAYYLADVDGGTYRAWLQEIADRVRAATAG